MSAEGGMKSNYGSWASALSGVLAIAGLAALSSAFGADAVSPADATSLKLSPSQYKLTISDVFGESIKVDGRFEPEQRDQGLLAIGARTSNITDAGLESYDDNALSIAAQVVDARHRTTLIGCTPATATGRDDACARQFFSRV